MSYVEDMAAETRARRIRLGMVPSIPPQTIASLQAKIAALEAQIVAYREKINEQDDIIRGQREFMRKYLPKAETTPRLSEIIDACAEHYRMTSAMVKGESRAWPIVGARHCYFFLARESGYSLPQIGRACGDRDHTSVLHGVEKIRARIAKDDSVKDHIEQIKTVLMGRVAERVSAAGEIEGLKLP